MHVTESWLCEIRVLFTPKASAAVPRTKHICIDSAECTVDFIVPILLRLLICIINIICTDDGKKSNPSDSLFLFNDELALAYLARYGHKLPSTCSSTNFRKRNHRKSWCSLLIKMLSLGPVGEVMNCL